jgi:hypothetical protein
MDLPVLLLLDRMNLPVLLLLDQMHLPVLLLLDQMDMTVLLLDNMNLNFPYWTELDWTKWFTKSSTTYFYFFSVLAINGMKCKKL